MTTDNPHVSLVLPLLQNGEMARLRKAISALADGSLTITLTRQTEAEIRALVQNGEGKEYGVTILETGATCSCPDALYRGVTCKHALALALHTIRTPRAEAPPAEMEAEPEERPVNLKLAKTRPGWVAAA